MNLENFPILELPPELILHVLKNYCYEELNDITVTCKTLHALIEENRNSLASKNIYHIDLFSASHESICQLLQASKCRGINFEAVESKLISKDLSLNGYRNLNSICFEMDDSIDGNFFASVLDISEARKFIFHACDNIPKEFVRIMFEKFLDGTREFDAVRITTNQNFSFDEIIADLNIQKLDNSTWKMKSTRGDEATITMRRNNFHFFVAFEVNDHRVEDILYKIPFIE